MKGNKEDSHHLLRDYQWQYTPVRKRNPDVGLQALNIADFQESAEQWPATRLTLHMLLIRKPMLVPQKGALSPHCPGPLQPLRRRLYRWS